MRPVNLIPLEDRRGPSATKGSGVAAYLIVGVLAVAVLAVAASTHFGNQVSEKEAEVAALESDVQAAQASAASNASFVSLQSIRDARVQTIDALAKSRFDWERVLRELARITPKDVAVTNVTGTVSPEVTVDGAASVPFRETVTGPALEILGCAKGQRDLAAFIAAMHDIDGVTRVTAPEGIRGAAPDEEGAASTTDSAGGCARSTDSVFQLVAAFDAVPVPEGALPADPATTTTTSTTTTESTATGATTASGTTPVDPETSESTAEAQQQIDNAKSQSDDATDLVPGG